MGRSAPGARPKLASVAVMRRTRLVLISAAVVVLGACTASETDDASTTAPADVQEEEEGEANGEVEVAMVDAEGASVGTVTLRPNDDSVRVRAQLERLTPGFHAFHIHDVGRCEAEAPDGPFTTAAGHFVGEGGTHGDHDGDLPSVFVTESGAGVLTVNVDSFTVEELTGGDGAAVMVHAGPDNFANIPDRYRAADAEASGSDEMTRSTGDAGARVACGVIGPAPA